MQYRVGKCGSCGATFKVPATFQGNKAKCKSCKSGVVAIGPVESADLPPAEQQEEFEEYVPSGKKRGGPSMKERLLMARQEQEARPKPVPAKKPAPASKPAARAAKPAPKARAAAKPAGKPGARSTARASRSDDADKPTTRSGARRAGASSRRGKDDDGEDGKSTGYQGRWHPKKKQSPAPFIGALVVATLAAFGLWKFVIADPAPAETDDNTVAAAAPGEGSETTTSDDVPVEDETTGTEDETIEDDAPVEDEAADPEPETPVVKKGDPSSVDLTLLSIFEATSDTSEEEWQEIKQLVATVVDPEAGAAGNRAKTKLVETYGKRAFPAIVNYMAKMDFSSEQGFRDGDVLQRALMDISNGRNAGWRYTTEPDDELFNKQVVVLLHKVWDKAKDNEAYWLEYSKQAKKDDEAEPELSDDDLGDLDDLDGF